MSPPCVATLFEGDNGGQTTRGVTATEIRVAVPVPSESQGYVDTVQPMLDYFNQRYEFYGRRLVPVFVGGDAATAVPARAKAADIASRHVFGALTGLQEFVIAQSALPMELARNGVVTVVRSGSTWWSDRMLFDALHPYVWSVYPSAEDVQTNLADFACTALANRSVTFAGDAQLQGQPRRFGVLTLGYESPPNAGTLLEAVERCADTRPTRVEWVSTAGTTALQSQLERLRADSATTLICVCEGGYMTQAADAAHAIGYHPEWLIPPTYRASGNDEHWMQSNRSLGKIGGVVRLSAGPRLLPVQARPWYAALELIPSATPLADRATYTEFVYSEFAVLAAGIQGAGPNLTPESFAAGLMAMQFPNPGAGQAPYYQPSAGFGAGDHSFYDDYHVGWWSDQAPALDNPVSSRPVGSWCYLDRAARYRTGAYPADAGQRLFNTSLPCR